MLRGQSGEPYNIGNDTPEISIRELAKRVTEISKRLFSYEGEVIFQKSEDEDYLVDNPQRRCPSIDKARADLDYDPKIDIDTGLERAMIWYFHNPVAEEA